MMILLVLLSSVFVSPACAFMQTHITYGDLMHGWLLTDSVRGGAVALLDHLRGPFIHGVERGHTFGKHGAAHTTITNIPGIDNNPLFGSLHRAKGW